MLKKILIGQMFLIIITIGYGQVWTARYQGPYGEDYANAIAVDNLKNVYVTGASQGEGAGYINDFATVKYDSLGIEQWAARYNGSPTRNWQDEARAIAVDANGVYVTGYISYYILEDSCDYGTIKYDKTTGDTLWLRKYNGSVNKCDQACAIGLDSAGNVYVTGSSYDLTTYYDCATIKYNSAGVQRWVQRYSYEGSWSDEGNAILVDDAGNVYVTGRSVSTTTSWDYATIKYNAGGAQQWVARYNGMENYDDEPAGIALDNLGNSYVTGKSGIGSFRYRFATVKYTPSGTQDWVKTYLGPANLSAWASAIAVDNQNNICVTGRDYGSDTTAEYVTIKYLPDSTEQWIARYSAGVEHGDDWATAICVDEDNCIYVTGSSESMDGDPDYLTLKYLPSGAGIVERPDPWRGDIRNSKLKIQNSKLSVYPNPFQTQTAIRFSLSAQNKVILKIYDVSGKLVKSFSANNPTRSVGQAKRDQQLITNNCLVWNGTDDSGKSVPPGVYYIGLITQNSSSVARAVRQ